MPIQKIFNVEQIRSLDNHTIENEPISSVDLMERASIAFVKWFMSHFDSAHPVIIFAGLGNNGGDGLAIARLLTEEKYDVEVNIIRHSESMSEDCKANYYRLPLSVIRNDISNLTEISKMEINSIETRPIFIDALLGSGLSREPEGLLKEVIEYINQSNQIIVSVDIASGLYADRQTGHSSIVNPDYTVAFQIPKLAFLIPENSKFIGNWNLVDIGLSQEFISKEKANQFYVTDKFVKSIYKGREKFSHKGTFGKALLVAGSFGKMGAAVLAAKGCLRAGIGLLTVHIPNCGVEILQTSVPEAMVISGKSKDYIESVKWKSLDPDVIGVGPGIGKDRITLKCLSELFNDYKNPMVIDADAINLLSENSELQNMIPPYSILTPHFKEFERLVGKSKNDFDRLEQLVNFSRTKKVYTILKGYHTAIGTPEGEIYFNSTGNAGMATGGSGDVLTGIITSLLAQKYSSFESSILGVYIHGLSGDLAVKEIGEESLIASDLTNYLGRAFLFLKNLKERKSLRRNW